MTDEPLVRAAVAMKHAGIEQWNLFLAALGERQYHAVNDCATVHDRDAIYRAQGRARELSNLLVLLRDADKTVVLYDQARRT